MLYDPKWKLSKQLQFSTILGIAKTEKLLKMKISEIYPNLL